MSVPLAVPGGGPADPGLSFTVNSGPSFAGSSAFGNGGALSVNRTVAKFGSVEAQVVAGDGSGMSDSTKHHNAVALERLLSVRP